MLKREKASRGLARDARAGRDSADIVIVGNGIAGLTAAVEARCLAPEKRIAIITEQSHPTINTPALKQFAVGKLTQEQLLAYPAGTERARHIEVISARVEEITSKRNYVSLEGGQRFGYGSLLLATGSKPNGLPADVPGRNFDGVLTLHRLSDYLDLHRRLRLREVRQAVVIGGGTHAMETVMGLLESGIRVHWLIRSATFLPHVLDHTASEMVLEYSRRAGIQVSTETEVIGITGRIGTVVGVVTNHQQTLPCQLVLVCTGTRAVTTLADHCDVPIKQQHGILVDEHLRTNVRDIFAAGDAAAQWNPHTGVYQPQAYWHAAVLQGRAAASAMTGCQEVEPFGVPWHATQLGELSLLTVGSPLHGLTETATVTNRRKESYHCLSIRDEQLVGYLSLGKTQPDSLAIKRLIDEGIPIRDIEKDLLAGELNARQYFAQRHFHAARTLVVTGELAVIPNTSHALLQASPRIDAAQNTKSLMLAPMFSGQHEMQDEEDPLQKRGERQASSIRSIKSLANIQTETRWIVPALLPEGLVVLAGKQKIGKSWLSLALGLGIASGETVLGSIGVEQGQVLYLAMEESERRLQERLSQLLLMGASLHHNFAYMTHWSRLQDDSLAEIEAWLVSHLYARLVIIDAGAKVQPDIAWQAHMGVFADKAVFERLSILAHTYHVNILLHCHTDEATVNHASGTLAARSGANTYADGILHLKGSRENTHAVLSGTGQAYTQKLNLALSFNNGCWKMAEQPDIRPRATLTPARRAIIDVLHEHDRPMKSGEIALALGKRAGTIRSMLYEMKACNFIQATDEGYVALIPQEQRPPRAKDNYDTGKKQLNSGRDDNYEHSHTRNITQFQRPRPQVNAGIRASTHLAEHAEGMLATSIPKTLPLIIE